jgi:undecaprenyl-diphosphatase
MDPLLLLKALIMGIVEGLTEFLPISSTGHLIVVGRLLQLPESIAGTFEIVIQLGAILAVVVYFARDLLSLLARLPSDSSARRLALGVVIAFVPFGIVGWLFGDQLREILFGPLPVAIAMIVGAVIILIVEHMERAPAVTRLEDITLPRALGVGLAQMASLIPGMSRSAATIVGGLLCGLDRVTALRFSFYLSIPILVVAGVYDLLRNLDTLREPGVAPAYAVGLVTSFVVALAVVHWFLKYVSKHTLKPFAWYRLAAGSVLIAITLLAPGWL